MKGRGMTGKACSGRVIVEVRRFRGNLECVVSWPPAKKGEMPEIVSVGMERGETAQALDLHGIDPDKADALLWVASLAIRKVGIDYPEMLMHLQVSGGGLVIADCGRPVGATVHRIH